MVFFIFICHNFVSDLPRQFFYIISFRGQQCLNFLYLSILKNEMTLGCLSYCWCICEANLINV